MNKVTLILSGGMDSATLAYWYHKQGCEIEAVTFNYGQRHSREIESAKLIAEAIGAKHHILDISGIQPLLKGSALTDEVEVPHGHYEADNMKLTVVPNRNAIMLSIAWGIACCNQSDILACGVHAGDHHIYPDCRPSFITMMNSALSVGTEGHRKENLVLEAPFVDKTKTDIAAIGGDLGVPYRLTWTCYEGGEKHCGKCGACQERKEAFRDSGVSDQTEYAA